jgi:large subunit ribosomal protein L6
MPSESQEDFMSRIGKQPVRIPKGVNVAVANGAIQVKGPKGTLSQPLVADIDVGVANDEVTVSRKSESTTVRASHGLIRALVQNMVKGVTDGFEKKLQIEGTGFRAEVKGKNLMLTLGFSHPVEFAIPAGVNIAVDKQTTIAVTGIDKQQVGQVSAIIRSFRPPDAYKGKGIRYMGETLRIKEGKSA